MMMKFVGSSPVVNLSRVCEQVREPVNDVEVGLPWRSWCDSDGVVYPITDERADNKLFDDKFYEHLYRFRPFCRNLVKNWNAAG